MEVRNHKKKRGVTEKPKSRILTNKRFTMEWYLKVLKQYVDFEGRARRKEYWMFFLFNILASVVASIIDRIIGFPVFAILYMLGVLLPSLAVAVRRLHDIGKSGWMILVSLIPFIGFIWLIVLLVTDSEPGDNAYGPNPKAEVMEF